MLQASPEALLGGQYIALQAHPLLQDRAKELARTQQVEAQRITHSNGHWHPAKSTYLFPVRALSRHVRGGLVSRLRRAVADARLKRIEDPVQVDAMLDTLMATEWVVYSKPCLTRTETVVDYLGRYSHRIALSDQRILAFEHGKVQLAWKDYRDGRRKVMDIDGAELLRRFLLHVLPKGFVRVRHYGFLANRCRRARLVQIRQAIAVPSDAPKSLTAVCANAAAGDDSRPCPRCRTGPLRVVAELAPRPALRKPPGR